MNRIIRSFLQYIKCIWQDIMLIICVIVPILVGLVIKLGIPALEKILIENYGRIIITPYYPFIDLIIVILVPIMFSFTGVMNILEELDNGTAKYIIVTPLGKSGYITAKIIIPCLIGFVYSVILLNICSIGNPSFIMTVCFSLFGCLLSTVVSLFVLTYAKNKVEGMALVKASGIMFIPLALVIFKNDFIINLTFFVPTFWLGKVVRYGSFIYFIPSFIICIVYIFFLYNKFKKVLL